MGRTTVVKDIVFVPVMRLLFMVGCTTLAAAVQPRALQVTETG